MSKVAGVRFGNSDRTYDYFAPFPVSVGDLVAVPGRRGQAVAEVVEIKDDSDRVEKSLLRLVDRSKARS